MFQLQQSYISYKMTHRSKKKIIEQQTVKYNKCSIASTGMTIGKAHLAFFSFTLHEFFVPASHAI
jgi:hypothetical protein